MKPDINIIDMHNTEGLKSRLGEFVLSCPTGLPEGYNHWTPEKLKELEEFIDMMREHERSKL